MGKPNGHVEIVNYEPEPLESGWWAVKDEPDMQPIFEWREDGTFNWWKLAGALLILLGIAFWVYIALWVINAV